MIIKNVKSVLLALVMIVVMFSFMVVSSTDVSAAEVDVSDWTELAAALSRGDTIINIVGDVVVPISNSFTLYAGNTINIQNGASLTTSSSSTFYIYGTLNNLGTFINNATFNTQDGGQIIHNGTTFTNNGTMNFTNNSILNAYAGSSAIANNGSITFDSSDFLTFPLAPGITGNPATFNNNSLTILNNYTVVDTLGEFERAVTNANLSNIIITADLTIPASATWATLPQGKLIFVGNGSGTPAVTLTIENQFVNEGTITVTSNSTLAVSGTGLILNKGTVAAAAGSNGTIPGGSASDGTVQNRRFDVSSSSLYLYNINNETYFATSDTNRVRTYYAGPLTLYGATTTNIVGALNAGTYNIIMENLNMNITTLPADAPSGAPIAPFSAVPDTTLNISLSGINSLSGTDVGLSHYLGLAPNTLTITSTSGGSLSATGTSTSNSAGIFAGDNRVIIGGNAVVTATGHGDGTGILSNNIVVQDTANLTGIHVPSAGAPAGTPSNAFASRPTLNPSAGYQAVVRSGAAAPGAVVTDHTSAYHTNSYANVSMQPISTTTTTTTTTTNTVPAGMISPQTGVYS